MDKAAATDTDTDTYTYTFVTSIDLSKISHILAKKIEYGVRAGRTQIDFHISQEIATSYTIDTHPLNYLRVITTAHAFGSIIVVYSTHIEEHRKNMMGDMQVLEHRF
jgi:hypothetical protein